MANRPTVSVVMATYNGNRFIKQQIDSIIDQLGPDDELIITDDGSRDETIHTVQDYHTIDSRIKLFNGPRKGITANFENGIKLATKEIIFLSDQDDVWTHNKVNEVLGCFINDASLTCVLHDVEVVDEELHMIEPSFFAMRKSKSGLFNNIIKNSFMGSAMAFRREMVDYIIPIPKNIPLHDQWIGIMCSKHGKVKMLDKTLGFYRRHESNASSFDHDSISKMIGKRINLSIDIINR